MAAERLGGKIEAAVAAVILVVVVTLFVKYYEPTPPTETANGNPAATQKAVQ